MIDEEIMTDKTQRMLRVSHADLTSNQPITKIQKYNPREPAEQYLQRVDMWFEIASVTRDPGR